MIPTDAPVKLKSTPAFIKTLFSRRPFALEFLSASRVRPLRATIGVAFKEKKRTPGKAIGGGAKIKGFSVTRNGGGKPAKQAVIGTIETPAFWPH